MSARAGLAEVLQVDPIVERTAAVDGRGAEDARLSSVAAAGHRLHVDRVHVQVRSRTLILVLLLPLRPIGHRVAPERRLVAVGCRDSAAVGDLAAFGARGDDPCLRRGALGIVRRWVVDVVVVGVGVRGDHIAARQSWAGVTELRLADRVCRPRAARRHRARDPEADDDARHRIAELITDGRRHAVLLVHRIDCRRRRQRQRRRFRCAAGSTRTRTRQP